MGGVMNQRPTSVVSTALAVCMLAIATGWLIWLLGLEGDVVRLALVFAILFIIGRRNSRR